MILMSWEMKTDVNKAHHMHICKVWYIFDKYTTACPMFISLIEGGKVRRNILRKSGTKKVGMYLLFHLHLPPPKNLCPLPLLSPRLPFILSLSSVHVLLLLPVVVISP